MQRVSFTLYLRDFIKSTLIVDKILTWFWKWIYSQWNDIKNSWKCIKQACNLVFKQFSYCRFDRFMQRWFFMGVFHTFFRDIIKCIFIVYQSLACQFTNSNAKVTRVFITINWMSSPDYNSYHFIIIKLQLVTSVWNKVIYNRLALILFVCP